MYHGETVKQQSQTIQGHQAEGHAPSSKPFYQDDLCCVWGFLFCFVLKTDSQGRQLYLAESDLELLIFHLQDAGIPGMPHPIYSCCGADLRT